VGGILPLQDAKGAINYVRKFRAKERERWWDQRLPKRSIRRGSNWAAWIGPDQCWLGGIAKLFLRYDQNGGNFDFHPSS